MTISARHLVISGVLVALALIFAAWFAITYSKQLSLRARPFIGDTEPMGDSGGASPTEVITWQLAFGAGNELSIKYKEVSRYQLKQNETIDDYLKQAARGKFPTGVPSVKDPKIEERKPYQRVETPLSIRHDGYAHMVFVLDDKNWHFTADHDPFEVQKGKENFYTNPKCAWIKNGQEFVYRQPSEDADCKVASFISNAKEDRRQNQDDLGAFATPFNFYVSIKAAGKRTRYLPLVIDPDVGYPGGSLPPP